jgi:hypothetical protein
MTQGHLAMEQGALFACPGTPPAKVQKRATRLTDEEKAERARLRKIEQDKARLERARIKAQEKEGARRLKIAEAEGGHVELPALVLRNGLVAHVDPGTVKTLLEPYLGAMCLDVETSGYPLGHRLYELRTIQLGGEDLAVVLDAADPEQRDLASWALNSASRLHAHSAVADIVPSVHAGLISWDDAWSKMRDSVIYAKLTDPKMSGSDANALKELAHDLLGDAAISPPAEKAKNALFQAMGCLVNTESTTPPERNGWYMVRKTAVTMARYAGSDVLDLGAVVRILEPQVPVAESVIERETRNQKGCGRVSLDGFRLDGPYVKKLIIQHEAGKAEAQRRVEILSNGTILNPSSPDVGEKLLAIDPEIELEVSEKTGRPSAAKGSLAPIARRQDLVGILAKEILSYRHHVTTLGLLLRPFEVLCDYGDGRMRPVVYTINAVTGRSSCRDPNGQQLSRQGGIRACVVADDEFEGFGCDFTGCEIRVAAGLSGDKQLLEAETSARCHACGHDPCACGKHHLGLHWMAAHLTFGPDATKENRYRCKSVIFRELFGGKPDSDVAERISWVFKNEIAPTYAAWDKWLRECYYAGSMVWRDYETGTNYSTPIEGRRRLIYRTYSGRNIYVTKGAHAAGNGAIQGTARELLVDGTLKWMDGPWGNVPILPVHDEIVAFTRKKESEQAVQYLRDCMRTTVLSAPGFLVAIDADPDEPWAAWPDSS